MSESAAVRAAVDLYLMPSRLRLQQSAPLPDGMLELLMIAAGDEDVTLAAAAAFERPPELLQRASRFFVEEVLLAPSSDSYRVFGLGADASQDTLRRHMALVAKWIHPDQGPSPLGHHYAARISLAWDDLKTPQRREDYDESLTDRAATMIDPVSGIAALKSELVAMRSSNVAVRSASRGNRKTSFRKRLVAFLRHIAYGAPP